MNAITSVQDNYRNSKKLRMRTPDLQTDLFKQAHEK
jgi:hypothetical protein